MRLNTAHFGEIEIDDGKVITFEEGVPGFDDVKKYVILSNEDETSPFSWLQSIDEPRLAFVVANPFLIMKDYDIEIKDEVLDKLSIQQAEDTLVYCVIVVPEDMTKISVNLKAPIIINAKNNKGIQIILDTDRYTVRHYILENLQRQEATENACSNEEKGTVDSTK